MLLLFIIFLVLYLNINHYFKNLISIKSDINNIEYTVQDTENKEINANILASISRRIQILIDYCKRYEHHPEMKPAIERLCKFNPNNISQNVKKTSSTSYSINKGEHIVLCLRSRDGQNRVHEINTIMYVVLHELAHVMSVSIGHTEEFYSNFKYITNKAIECNVYKVENKMKRYCGLDVHI